MDLTKFKVENLTTETIDEVNKMTNEELAGLIELDGFFRVAKKGVPQGQGTYKSLYSLRKSHGKDYSIYSVSANKIIPKVDLGIKKEAEFIEPKTPIVQIEPTVEISEVIDEDPKLTETKEIEKPKRGRKAKLNK